jgi:hypothetical protein
MVFTANYDTLRYSIVNQSFTCIIILSSLVIFLSIILSYIVTIINSNSYCSIGFNTVVFKYNELALIAFRTHSDRLHSRRIVQFVFLRDTVDARL